MLRRFNRAINWVGVVKYYHNREFSEFLRNLSDYEKSYRLNIYERALKGFASLMVGDYESSEKIFSKLSQELGAGKTQKERYVSLFARTKLDSFSGNDKASEEKRLEALRLRPGRLYTRMLPL